MVGTPKTLQAAIQYFSNPDNCLKTIVARRWPTGVICPTCGSTEVRFLSTRRLWECKSKHPKKQFSVKVGTIFEDSPLGLDKWLCAMWLVVNCKNGISSYEVGRDLGVSQKSAWHMLHRIRLAMQDDLTGGMLSGEVEIDETFIGGKIRNMHKARKAKVQAAYQKGTNKTIVLGILEREGKVRATVIPDRTKVTIQENIKPHVEAGSTIYSDERGRVWGSDEYTHKIVNHMEAYVKDNIHTNGLENFWSLLKRGIGGTYISVEPFHLFRYIDEQAFRYNNRKDMNDSDRFDLAVRSIVGKRLTWAEVTGKKPDPSPSVN
jgi:ISXO2 transposase-like protein/transposase-like zinc ribbon protein